MPPLAVDHLVHRTATGKAEIDHLRQPLIVSHNLKAVRPAGRVAGNLHDTQAFESLNASFHH